MFEGNQLEETQIKFLERYVNGSWSVGSDGLVDVKGNVLCSGGNFLMTFHRVKFGVVTGDFLFGKNKLRVIEGSPREIGGSCNFYDNDIISLVGGPEKVGMDFNCAHNSLTSLEGAPREVGGSFNCIGNPITSLKGAPEKFGAIKWSEGNSSYESNRIISAINDGSELVWDLLDGEDRNEKLNLYLESNLDDIETEFLDKLIDSWYRPSSLIMSLYRAKKKGL